MNRFEPVVTQKVPVEIEDVNSALSYGYPFLAASKREAIQEAFIARDMKGQLKDPPCIARVAFKDGVVLNINLKLGKDQLLNDDLEKKYVGGESESSEEPESSEESEEE